MSKGPNIRAIEAWLCAELGLPATHFDEPKRRMTVFSVESSRPEGDPELEISRSALEDHTAEEIIGDLERGGVLDVFRRDPTMRLTYTTDRQVVHIERLTVHVDHHAYRVLRDAEHNVRILDEADQPLEGLPQRLLVLGRSIFRRRLDEWADDIRKWRVPKQ